MIDIYTEKKNSKNWILKNDLYFKFKIQQMKKCLKRKSN